MGQQLHPFARSRMLTLSHPPRPFQVRGRKRGVDTDMALVRSPCSPSYGGTPAEKRLATGRKHSRDPQSSIGGLYCLDCRVWNRADTATVRPPDRFPNRIDEN